MQREEKRRFRRIDLHTPVRYQIRGESDFDNTVSDNISAGGLAFNSLKFIPPSTAVMLEIGLLCRMLHPIGRVSWCQPLPHSNRNRLGVEFVEFSFSEKSFLSEYINIKTDINY
ncbi:MAG: PilZ domain-containing protein [Candidatus Omnitrophica bacterium]|nr:PilZ domain-containing protein [Candidatus Omnitrophota bacterium]